MAHFAELNEDNVVIRVVVISNSEIEGDEETNGTARCQELFGVDTRWKQTSYNRSFRKNYAGPGYAYDAERDAFVPPKPYESWTLNEETCNWEAPKAMPDDGKPYFWDEGLRRWICVTGKL